MPLLDSFNSKLIKVRQLVCPLQFKLALLKFLQWSLLYLISGSTHAIADILSAAADESNAA